jgi:two-component system, NtrC family, response regulator HydG
MILVVDDEPSNRRTLRMVLERENHTVLEAQDGQQAFQLLQDHSPQIMITDLKMPNLNGIELLKRAKTQHPSMEVIMMTAYGTIDTAVEAMKLGAWDFITKPIKRGELLRAVQRALKKHSLQEENRALRAELAKTRPSNWIGQSRIMQELTEEVLSVADSEASVFLVGASGTGKSRLARWIHKASPRGKYPFVILNCGAIPESLLESEMFGHEKWAFTGANQRKIGKFEAAHNGTLFLDEVTEMAPHLQVKLLRILQDGEFERVGGVKTITSNVRILAATNRDPSKAITEGILRQDIYYRLNVIQLSLPDLKERQEDIPLLAEHFLQIHSSKNSRPLKNLTKAALHILQAWSWPGNVRELENVIERAVVLSKGEVIDVPDLPAQIRNHIPEDNVLHFPIGTPLKEVERRMIETVLNLVDGDKNKAAELLGMTVRTLYRREAEWKKED